ncbi:nodulation protein NfeD [bacterium]|nr:nodulation protein NfeD [candidate division CSSED10-310 bacterium]
MMRNVKIIYPLLVGLFLSVAVGADSGPIYIVTIDDAITPITTEYVNEGLAAAEEADAECFVILLNTPGGLVSSTWDIVVSLMNASVPTVVYVYPRGARAASAGHFITYSANVAAMSPATNIGAAHVVSGDGSWPEEEDKDGRFKRLEKILERLEQAQEGREDSGESRDESGGEAPEEESHPAGGEVMAKKIMNDTVAKIRAIAKFRGRDETFAEQAVRESVSLTEEEALGRGVIDLVATSVDDLIQRLDGREVVLPGGVRMLATARSPVVYYHMNWRLRFLQTLANPNIALALLSLGGMGIMIEVWHPGLIFPGVVGGFCLVLGSMGLQILPINYAGLLLLLLAFVLFVLEFKVPSFGLLTMGGVASMILGAMILIDTPFKFMRVSLSFVLPLAFTIGLITALLVTLVTRVHRLRTHTGVDGMVGMSGVVKRSLEPEGTVLVHGELWQAVSDEPLAAGARVRIERVEGLKVIVSRL